MQQKVSRGLILMVGLGVLWIVLAHPTGTVQFPSDIQTEISRKHATWEEKRENKRIAKTYAAAGWGWRGKEWLCLHDLWTRESRFDHLAQNPTSSAFGIAQRLGERDSRPRIQILHGLRYIHGRYSSPCRALMFHNRNGYY